LDSDLLEEPCQLSRETASYIGMSVDEIVFFANVRGEIKVTSPHEQYQLLS